MISFDQLNQLPSYTELINQLKEDASPSERGAVDLISERNLVESMLQTQQQNDSERARNMVQKQVEAEEQAVNDIEFNPDPVQTAKLTSGDFPATNTNAIYTANDF